MIFKISYFNVSIDQDNRFRLLKFLWILTNTTFTLTVLLSSFKLKKICIYCTFNISILKFHKINNIYHLSYALHPIIPNNASPFCITAAAGTELARTYSSNTVIIVFEKRILHLKNRLHHSRKIAGSNFRPLPNIPHCCLFQVRTVFQFLCGWSFSQIN